MTFSYGTDDVFLTQQPTSAASKPASVAITGRAPLVLLSCSPTLPPAWLQRRMLRLSFQKCSNNTSIYKSTWNALQLVIWLNVCSIVIPDIKSASAAAHALAHCSSHRTLHPKRMCSPFSVEVPPIKCFTWYFEFPRAEATLVACCISQFGKNPESRHQRQSNQFAVCLSHKWELNT